MANAHSGSLTLYYHCPSCGKIFADIEGTISTGAAPLPCCGTAAAGAELWPVRPARILLENLRSLDAPSSAVLLYAAVELVMESSLAELQKRHAPAERSPKLLPEKNRTPGALKELYRAVGGSSFDDLCAFAGDGGFPSALDQLFATRCRVLADAKYAVTPDEKENVALVLDGALKLLAAVHGNVCALAGAPAAAEAGKSVLVVDDENAVTECMGRFFRRHGFTVFTAGTSRTALDAFAAHRPRYVFLDIALPDVSGLNTMEQMKKLAPGTDIFFVTGLGGEAIRREVMKLGARGFFPKPVDMEALVKLVRTL